MGSSVRKSLWNTYDHLGGLMLTNLVWLVATLPFLLLAWVIVVSTSELGPVGVVSGGALAVVIIWLSPTTVTVIKQSQVWAGYGRTSIRESIGEFKALWKRSLGTMALMGGVILLLGVNSWFYFTRMDSGSLKWVGFTLGGLMLWGELFVLAVVYHAGLVLAKKEQPNWRKSLKQSALLFLDNPLQTLAGGAGMLILAALMVVSRIGVLLFLITLPAMFAATWQRELLKKYRNTNPKTLENDRLEEVRTLKDLIKPWQT